MPPPRAHLRLQRREQDEVEQLDEQRGEVAVRLVGEDGGDGDVHGLWLEQQAESADDEGALALEQRAVAAQQPHDLAQDGAAEEVEVLHCQAREDLELQPGGGGAGREAGSGAQG